MTRAVEKGVRVLRLLWHRLVCDPEHVRFAWCSPVQEMVWTRQTLKGYVEFASRVALA